jgi:hypothetical protein
VFQNRLLRRMFEPKRDEVAGEWRKLHNEELRDFCSSPSIIKPRRMFDGEYSTNGENRNEHGLLA